MTQQLPKLGIIAGSGKLPEHIIKECISSNREYFVLAIENETNFKTLEQVAHKWISIGLIGEAIDTFKKEKVTEITFAGRIKRPNFFSLKTDGLGLKLVGKITKGKLFNDSSLFSIITNFFEGYGFKIVGAETLFADSVIKEGLLTNVKPTNDDYKDIELGKTALIQIANLDVGQALIIQNGLILGIEAVEGTDELIKRCTHFKTFPQGGVLVKIAKPNQDKRVDLPTIGKNTIEEAHKAGLSGIAVEALSTIILDREAVVQKANELGIFLIGI
jgi:DUF1009 family protein